MRTPFAAMLMLASGAALLGSGTARPKDVREIAKGGIAALPASGRTAEDPDTDVRVEAVRQITEIGTLPAVWIC